MRQNIAHPTLKQIYLKFGRKSFRTYSFFNMFRKVAEFRLSDELERLCNRLYLMNIHNSSFNMNAGVADIQAEFKLTGKAIYELAYVYPELNIQLEPCDTSSYTQALILYDKSNYNKPEVVPF
jgi:hypothetical protein